MKTAASWRGLAALTFDIDWAPDWAVRTCQDICRTLGVPATFFATHESEALDELRSDTDIQLGIHPNFLSDSTHGGSLEEVLDHCVEVIPEARVMRTHGLYQSTTLFALIAEEYPMIETDVSLYLAGHQDLHPVDLYCGNIQRRITRLPYFWEDDLNAMTPSADWTNVPPSDGLRIFDFHPIHVCLNMAHLGSYRKLKRALGHRKLQSLGPEDIAPYVNTDSEGTRTFLERVVDQVGPDRFTTVSAITERYLEGMQ